MLVGVILGILVGLISSFLGLGGSILLVPTLPTLASLTIRESVIFSVFLVNFVTLQNTYFYHRKKLVDFRFIKLTFIPLSFLSYVSAYFSSQINHLYVYIILLIVLSLMIVKLLLPVSKTYPKKLKNVFLSISILVSGTLSGIIGMGNGLVLSPTLLAFQIIPHAKISPTINASIFLGSLFTLLGYYQSEELIPVIMKNSSLGLTIFFASMVSALIGRRINNNISEKKRRVFISLLLAVMFIQTIVKVLP